MADHQAAKITQPASASGVTQQVSPRYHRGLLAGAAVLAAVCSALYANAVNNPFHFDDISIILTDPRVQGLHTSELITGNYWYLDNTDRLYRPLTMLSYAANWAVARQAWAFRLPNLALHAGVCVLLLALVWRVFGSYAAALGTSLAFAVHPLAAEPLNTIVGRADLLTALLMLGAAVLYWDDAGPGARRGPLRPVAAALCVAAAVLCKENALTLIGVVAVLDAYRAGPEKTRGGQAFWLRRLLRCYGPMLLVIGGYLALRVHLLGSLTSDSGVIDYFENAMAHPEHGLNADEGDSAWLVRWATPLATMARAVRLAVAPNDLCFDYSYAALEPVRRWADPRLWAGVGLLLAAVVWFILSLRRRRRVALAIAVSAITYSIVSNAVVIIGTIFGERLIYLPNAGFCLLLGLAADFAFRRSPPSVPVPHPVSRRVVAAGLVILGMWYAFLTVERNRDWRSPRALYESAYEVNPRSCKVLAGMASNALEDDDYPRALRYCQAAWQDDVAPEYWPAWRTAAVALRRMSAEAADPQRSEFLAQQAHLYFIRAMRLGAGGDPDAVLGVADLGVELNRDYEQAIRITGQFVRHRPTHAPAFDRLARWLLSAEPPELRDPRRALEYARQARRLKPEVANYALTLVDALMAVGQTAEATALIHQTLESLPADSPGIPEFRRRLEQLGP